MKVLWLGQQSTNLPWLNDLRHELSRLCEVVAYGDGGEFIPEFNVETIVKKENPDVIMMGNNQYKFIGLGNVNGPKALKCTDNWANIWQHIKFIKDNDIQLILMNYNCVTPEYMKHLPRRKFGRLPHTLNTNLFKNLGLERTIDVMCIASYSFDTYPLRAFIYREYKANKPPNVFINEPHSLSFEQYVRKINESKIFAFGNVNRTVGNSPKLIFPMAKIYEIMGCETLCMMDSPDEAEELHFVPLWNYVPITKDDWKTKVWYYLEHEKERKQIAERGLYTCVQYHTVEVRTRELKTMLEEICKK